MREEVNTTGRQEKMIGRQRFESCNGKLKNWARKWANKNSRRTARQQLREQW